MQDKTILKLRGVTVNFPYKPYDCQVRYMSKVIECLQERKNGVLESPTGTGKTLCLLCATLAWRDAQLLQSQLVDENDASKDLQEDIRQAAAWSSGGPNCNDVPKIIYTSRTHSQLTQAVKELKTTVYRPKVCVLGSRDQLCIHPKVQQQETNNAKMHLCRTKVNAKTCVFYNNLDKEDHGNNEVSNNILDIEDLVSFGKDKSCCPYFLSRNQKKYSDLIFMPYYYVIDAKSRSAHGIDINNSIILFDEAHNIEQICEESMSFDLTSLDVASCIEDLGRCYEVLISNEAESLPTAIGDDGNPGEKLDFEKIGKMKDLLLKLEGMIHGLVSDAPKEGITKPGSYILELLGNAGITKENAFATIELLEKVCTFLVADESSGMSRQVLLNKFADALKVVFNSCDANGCLSDEVVQNYKVHLQATQQQDGVSKNKRDPWATRQATTSNKGYSLGYWCFSPGETMKELMKSDIRSMILTSGTLSPITSFKAELQIDIPVELENPHVIRGHQMFVGILKRGPDGTMLNSSYQNRTDSRYMNSVGQALVNFSHVIPDGMLVFFPSYSAMEECTKQWQTTTVWRSLEQRKGIFVEPRGKSEFAQTMQGFYDRVRSPEHRGAIFFAVCRGKVSEGVDFSDINGRAVVIIGLPFPPTFNPKVKLKENFLNDVQNKRKFKLDASLSSSCFKAVGFIKIITGLSGKQWYNQQATRAVNQAIGRVLRHRNDFGAIILCDHRFSYKSNLSELPRWMQPYVHVLEHFSSIQGKLVQFFRGASSKCDPKMMKVKKLTCEELAAASAAEEERKSKEKAILNETEQECHWIPQDIKELKTNEKAAPVKAEVVRRREEKCLPRPQIIIEYEEQSSDKKKEAAPKSGGLFDSLRAYETDNKKKEARECDTQLPQTCQFSAYSGGQQQPTQAVKKKLKIVRPKSQADNVKVEKIVCPKSQVDDVEVEKKIVCAKSQADNVDVEKKIVRPKSQAGNVEDKKIVRAKSQADNVEDEKKKSVSVPETLTEEKAAAVKKYLKKVRKIIGAEKLPEYLKVVKEYRVSGELQPLIHLMVTTFLANKKHYEVYLGFSAFMSERDRQIYLQKFVDITGEDVPEEFQKRKRAQEMEASVPCKKMRTDIR